MELRDEFERAACSNGYVRGYEQHDVIEEYFTTTHTACTDASDQSLFRRRCTRLLVERPSCESQADRARSMSESARAYLFKSLISPLMALQGPYGLI